MKVIYKIDKIFLLINSAIIIFSTLIFFFIFENPIILFFGLFIELFYLVIALRDKFRRIKAIKRKFPEKWREILSKNLNFYRAIDGERKSRFENDVKIFLSSYRIERIEGKEVDEKKKIIIAGAVASMLNGRPEWEPPFKDSIVIYPANTIDKEFNMNKGNITGMAPKNGPMIITEGGLEYSFFSKKDSYNVIYHEIAHFFDWEDGEAGGIPMTRILPSKIERWRRIIHREWIRVRRKPYLRSYAGTNEAEFFAVATEYFFENPSLLKKNTPEVYELLKDFYNLDTVNILNSKR